MEAQTSDEPKGLMLPTIVRPAGMDAATEAIWQKAYDTIVQVGPEAEAAIAVWLQDRGLTATSAKHVWIGEDGTSYEIREGVAPIDEFRPTYLQALPLTICQFRLPGVVIKFTESKEERYLRLKRNPKAGELEELIKSLGKTNEASAAKEEDPEN